MALKWVLEEPGSDWAEALARGGERLLMPDFWLGEATNVLWLQVRRGVLTREEAQRALALLGTQVPPTPTAGLGLHATALEIGLAVGHSPYDALYVAFAQAMGARGPVVSDRGFVAAMRRHPDPAVAALLIPLEAWARAAGLG